jgi:hypothetical protein
MKKSLAYLRRSGRDESGTRVAGNYRHKGASFHCTCIRDALGAKTAGENQPELNLSSSFTMPLPHAALLHFRRIARRGAGCVSFRAAGRAGGGSGFCGSRTVAAPAGLWARRTHEDRNRPGALSLGRASWQDDRLADRGVARESRLAELERVAAGRNGRSGETQARGVAAARVMPILPER